MLSRSPIDPTLLEAVLTPTPGRARTLPAEAYTSQAVFDWETEHLFEGGWVCVGRAPDLAEPGDQRAFRIGSEGILVVRDLAGAIRGFYNTCRHRGHELLEPGTSRNLRAIRCPYHAWVYRLDGALGAAPRFGDVAGFDRADHPLVAARVQEWEGWIFVNADGGAPALEDHLGNLCELVRPSEPSRLVVTESHEHVIQADWKTITERYHGCSHGPAVLSVGLFPNLLLSLHPDSVMTHRIQPLGPARCQVECQWLVSSEAAERPGFSPASACEFWVTDREDRLENESVHTFTATVARAYLDGRASEPPLVHEPDPAGA